MDRINHGIINHHMAGLFLRMRMRSLPRIRLSQPVSICHIDGLLLLTSAHIQHSLQYLSYWCFTITNISSYTDTIRIPLVRTFWSICDRCGAIWFHWARRILHRTALGPEHEGRSLSLLIFIGWCKKKRSAAISAILEVPTGTYHILPQCKAYFWGPMGLWNDHWLNALLNCKLATCSETILEDLVAIQQAMRRPRRHASPTASPCVARLESRCCAAFSDKSPLEHISLGKVWTCLFS